MEKRLTADLNVVANSNLEIQMLDGDLNIIQKLDDEPNDVGGLTSAELKAKFDEGGNIIKKYINETLIPAVLTEDATEESRKQAEAARVVAEQGRVTAEEGRVSAESVRVSAEQGRSEAESSRVSAENAREAAEQARADETAGIVARATAQANAAAESATEAAGAARSASGAAVAASSSASDAQASATAASGSASQAQASAAAAAQSAASVDGINKAAQSWAVGGTGTRPGEDTDNAKYWAQQAAAAVGGDFATKTEAQDYVSTHNQSDDAHTDIREALSKAGKQFIINGTLGDDGEKTVTVDKTRAEVKAAVQAGESVMLHLDVHGVTGYLPLTEFGFTDDTDFYYFGAMLDSLCVVTLYYIGTEYQARLSTADIPPLSNDAPSAPGVASAGTSDDAARADHVHPSERPKAAQVTLTAAGWDSSTKKQTVTVSGVLADTSKQVIWVAFASETALDAYMDAGIVPVAQGANTVTFRADTVPTADITVNIVVQEVGV